MSKETEKTQKEPIKKKKFFKKKNSRSRFNDQSNLITETIAIKAVSNTTKGGRQRSLSVIVIVGNGKGSLGVGKGKASNLSNAFRSATAKAKKNLKKYNLEEKMGTFSFTHTCIVKHCGVKLRVKPQKHGGLKGHTIFNKVAKCLGVEHAEAKIHANASAKANILQAVLKYLDKQEQIQEYANKLGTTIKNVKKRIYANLFRKKTMVKKVENDLFKASATPEAKIKGVVSNE